MPSTVVSKASTTWNGELMSGSGTTTLDSSGAATFDLAWGARAEGSDSVTNPEELLAAAHATCFSMALSHALTGNGTAPTQIRTTAAVSFVAGTGVTGIELSVTAEVPGISEEDFQQIAADAKENCPISQALRGTEISLNAVLD